MIRKRNIGSLAAIGGMTAAVALLTGFPAARADEMADLRANQQLLQQRIDQLAQAQQQAQLPATFCRRRRRPGRPPTAQRRCPAKRWSAAAFRARF